MVKKFRYGAVTKDPAIPSVIEDVFEKARHYQVGVDSTGTPRYCDNFINDYYDDEGWWALAWIEASKLTGEKKYLDMAEIIFDDMTTGWSDACGGAIPYTRPLSYFQMRNFVQSHAMCSMPIRDSAVYPRTTPTYKTWSIKENWIRRMLLTTLTTMS